MMLVMAALVLPVFNAEFLWGLLRGMDAGTATAANLGWLALFCATRVFGDCCVDHPIHRN